MVDKKENLENRCYLASKYIPVVALFGALVCNGLLKESSTCDGVTIYPGSKCIPKESCNELFQIIGRICIRICPRGQKLDESTGKCVTDDADECQKGVEIQFSNCVCTGLLVLKSDGTEICNHCPADTIWDANKTKCKCPANSSKDSEGKCQCESGFTKGPDGICTAIICPDDGTLDANKGECQCRENSYAKNDGTCECNDGLTKGTDGSCTNNDCQGGTIWDANQNKCKCPENSKDKEGKCQCDVGFKKGPDGSCTAIICQADETLDANQNICKCPENSSKDNGKCKCNAGLTGLIIESILRCCKKEEKWDPNTQRCVIIVCKVKESVEEDSCKCPNGTGQEVDVNKPGNIKCIPKVCTGNDNAESHCVCPGSEKRSGDQCVSECRTDQIPTDNKCICREGTQEKENKCIKICDGTSNGDCTCNQNSVIKTVDSGFQNCECKWDFEVSTDCKCPANSSPKVIGDKKKCTCDVNYKLTGGVCVRTSSSTLNWAIPVGVSLGSVFAVGGVIVAATRKQEQPHLSSEKSMLVDVIHHNEEAELLIVNNAEVNN